MEPEGFTRYTAPDGSRWLRQEATRFDEPAEFYMVVVDDLNAPRIEPGESAVINTGDREPMDGRLFLVRWNDGRRSIVVLRAVAESEPPMWEAGFLNDPTTHGPWTAEEASSRIIGRVTGIFSPEPDQGGDVRQPGEAQG
jgi:hypothetical protein